MSPNVSKCLQMSPNVSKCLFSPLPGSLGIKFPTILISENLGNLIGAGTALEDIVNEHKKKETTDRSKIS